MARFTLSIADDVAAKLDAYAAENNLNRSQAAEHIFRSAFQPVAPGDDETQAGDPDGDSSGSGDLAYLADQVLEMQDYLTLLISNHQTLRNLVITTTDMETVSHHPRLLPEAPWVRRARGY